MKRRACLVLALLLATDSAAFASSFAELRRLAATLPADDWFFDHRLEAGYARPIPVDGLNAGWLALTMPLIAGVHGTAQFESVRAPLVRDQRFGLGLQWNTHRARMGVLALGRRLNIASRPTWAQRTLRVSLSWREGRWNVGGQWEVDPHASTRSPPRLSVGLEDPQWRLRLLRRGSSYESASIWEGGFEVRPTTRAALGLRLTSTSATLGVSTWRGRFELRLSTALDGARAGGLSLAVLRP